jgi:Cu-Zn family superoxide dismutase
MHRHIFAVVLAAVGMAAASQGTADANAATKRATASFVRGDGAHLGVATLLEGPKGVLIKLELKGLTPGWHAIHVHQTGDCSDGSFMQAGGHVMEEGHGGHQHDAKLVTGLLIENSSDAGALPNVYADADGRVMAELYSTYVSLTGADGRTRLLDADGASIVIHDKPEDHLSTASTAGKRAACAVIK